jgi:hypothetical protein
MAGSFSRRVYNRARYAIVDLDIFSVMENMKKKSVYFILGSSFFMDNLRFARLFLEETTSVTYPVKTLKRRLGLLTSAEKARVSELLNKICDCAEKIDEIISNRAERANDKWP